MLHIQNMILTQYNCAVCGKPCPAYIESLLEVKETGEWVYHIKLHDTPAYFLKDKMFCGPDCCLKWYQG